MNEQAFSITFGPVPSRRLGRSLGINNLRGKSCSYSCVYCQVGRTWGKRVEPGRIFAPAAIRRAVAEHLQRLGGQPVDYLTFVPDGEPTLDILLGEHIEALREFGIPVAVISNATLLWRPEVRARLRRADLVSLKVDSLDEAAWRRVNRPHRALGLGKILHGVRAFAADYAGALITETMLLRGINDGAAAVAAVADFLAGLAPRTAYLAVPTRPTADGEVRGTDEAGLVQAHRLFSDRLPAVELLTGHETGEFAHTGEARVDLLAVTAVHPMRETAVRRLLARDAADWSVVEALLASGELRAVDYAGERFYLRPARRGS